LKAYNKKEHNINPPLSAVGFVFAGAYLICNLISAFAPSSGNICDRRLWRVKGHMSAQQSILCGVPSHIFISNVVRVSAPSPRGLAFFIYEK
jgi:hypothetical protein